MNVYKHFIIKQVKKGIIKFTNMDLNDPLVAVGLTARVHTILHNIQYFSGLESDLIFDYDPDPYLKISWWGRAIKKTEITFRFNPLRVEGDSTDLIIAYNRAMSII